MTESRLRVKNPKESPHEGKVKQPSRTKARYTEEYKKEALELWRNSGRSAAKVAAELGIRAPLLYRWARPKRQGNLSGNESESGRSVEELEAGQLGEVCRRTGWKIHAYVLMSNHYHWLL